VLSLARWCSDHRRAVVVLWIAAFIGVTAAWQSVGSAYTTQASPCATG
jgi:hypothetical protein